MRVADLVLEVLSAHGVHDVFGVSGDAINDIIYALKRQACFIIGSRDRFTNS